MKVLRQAGR